MTLPRRGAASLLAQVIGIAAFSAAGMAAAAEFTLNPTRVHLDRERPVETLVLGNADQRPLSFEVSVQRWTMDERGGWQLAPSEDLIVHPLVFTVAPGEQGRLRVGRLDAAVDSEHAYRIELQQLPSQGDDGGVQVELLTRVSVPVFVQPVAAPEPVPAAIDEVALGAEGLRLTVVNPGGRYLPPQPARVRLLGDAGQVLHEAEVTVGYVLAGSRLPLSLSDFDRSVCRRARRVELRLAEAGGTLEGPVPADARRCGD